MMLECIGGSQQEQNYNLQRDSAPHLIDDIGGDFCQQTSGQQQHKLLSMHPQQQQQLLQQQHHHQQQLQRQQTLVEQQQQQQSGNELIGYYFGSISRETAEWILKTHGNQMDGAYLLRSSGPNDDFVLSIMVNHIQAAHGGVVSQQPSTMVNSTNANANNSSHLEVLHYKIVETEDSFVALHGQVGDEKFATIDELIDKAQGVATKPKWPIHRQPLESQILPPTYWGLTVDQVRLAIYIKAKQWGFPLLSNLFVQGASPSPQDSQVETKMATTAAQQQIPSNSTGEDQAGVAFNITTLNNETIRTLIYKSLHEFQPWFHGKISREEAELRIEEGSPRDGRFLVRERDNYSYAMCISHKRTTKHYRIDVLPTGELAIQDGRKFTSLMALVSHYTIMSDGLWCALTEACARPTQPISSSNNSVMGANRGPVGGSMPANDQLPAIIRKFATDSGNSAFNCRQSAHCMHPSNSVYMMLPSTLNNNTGRNPAPETSNKIGTEKFGNQQQQSGSAINYQGGVTALKAPIKEWLQSVNQKWSQLLASKNQHHSLNSFLFGNQNPLNNHCRHNHRGHHHHHHHNHQHQHQSQRSRKCKNGHASCAGYVQPNGIAIGKKAGTLMTLPHTASNHSSQTSANRAKSMNQSAEQANKATSNMNNNKNNNNNCCTLMTNSWQAAAAVAPGNSPDNILRLKDLIGYHNAAGSPARILEPSTVPVAPTNALLGPQNSGFALNNFSFIGSPLFAIPNTGPQKPSTTAQQHQSEANKNQLGHSVSSRNSGGSGSSSSDNNNIGLVGEEKLISPAQSISANLNSNPYNLNNDIYGSQTSTALMNSILPTSSSSSSGNMVVKPNGCCLIGSTNLFSAGNNPAQHQQQLNYGLTFGPANNNGSKDATGCTTTTMLPSGTTHAGPILCGHHAGPAYRYTNCTDENFFRPCFHRPQVGGLCRAADDSQLMTSSTQLAAPAAMAKFVQFQDGQCLRTHRDTRSIQMAYLSSKSQAMNGNNVGINHQQPAAVPFRYPGNCPQQQHQIGNSNLAKSNVIGSQQFGSSNPNVNVSRAIGEQVLQQQQQQQKQQRNVFQGLVANQQSSLGLPASNIGHQQQSSAANQCGDIDLMDCGDGDGGFDFKYDPKLIKSSSIETLCGVGDDEAPTKTAADEDLANYKSNLELVMSLQACWLSPNRRPLDVLSPMRPHTINAHGPACEISTNSNNIGRDQIGYVGGVDATYATAFNDSDQELDANELGDGSILSSLINIDNGRAQRLDEMKKKHDIEEFYTASVAKLAAGLKAQVDLKNKRAGLGLQCPEKSEQQHSNPNQRQQQQHNTEKQQGHNTSTVVEVNPIELVNEFDTLKTSNNK